MEKTASGTSPKNTKGPTSVTNQHPPEFSSPFENIALAFSGGGFRAASFGLGVVSYLNQVTFKDSPENHNAETSLLKKVKYMSSASGGTITTALYALYNVKGKSFSDYYKKLSDAMYQEKLVDSMLKLLANPKSWNSKTKNRNIINAFSEAYHEDLFDKATVKDLKVFAAEDDKAGGHKAAHNKVDDDKDKPHLEEVCFNTTEFYRGVLFKQQVKMKYDEPSDWFQYGSSFVNLPHETAEQLRLGDLLAASSCFPAGFEPIVFPDDFATDDAGARQLWEKLFIKPESDDIPERKLKANPPKIGMMDGGITDNQGLESMMTADERRRVSPKYFKPFDLMMVNDVGSNFMDPYVPPTIKPGMLSGLFNITAVLVVLAAIIALYIFKTNIHPQVGPGWLSLSWARGHVAGAMGLIAFFCAIITAVLLGAGFYAKSEISKAFSAPVGNKLLAYVRKLSFYLAFKFAAARVSSIVTMATEVFLKRVRELLYQKFYGTPIWDNRGKANHLYDLSFSGDLNRKPEVGEAYKPKGPPPSRPMQIVAENAFSMGTTLWYGTDDTKTNKMGCVIATGQFTTCYNLLEYIERLQISPVYHKLSAYYKGRVETIKAQLEADYEHFKTDPFYLYNSLGDACNVAGFKPLNWLDIPFPENFEGLR